jgi:Transglycosylase-like domain
MSWGQVRIAACACALALMLTLAAWSSSASGPWRLGAASTAKVVTLKRSSPRQGPVELPAGVSRATLESIAACESGGDPRAVSADGSYRGKYQFDRGTWASVGGSGDPAAAPESEQDRRAALLYSRSGTGAWPVCG